MIIYRITSHEECAVNCRGVDEINFHFSTDENNGVYMDAQMLKLDDEIVDLIEKLQKFFEKFKLKWIYSIT